VLSVPKDTHTYLDQICGTRLVTVARFLTPFLYCFLLFLLPLCFFLLPPLCELGLFLCFAFLGLLAERCLARGCRGSSTLFHFRLLELTLRRAVGVRDNELGWHSACVVKYM
jgi:hypothetical protein